MRLPLRPVPPLCGALSFAILLQCAVADAANERRTLRYQFADQETAYYLVSNESSLQIQHSEVEATVRHGNDTLKHYRVLSVDDQGRAVLELTIDHTRMYAEQGPTLFTYDSDQDREPPAAFGLVQGTVGKPWMHVTISPRGVVVDRRLPAGSENLGDSNDFVSAVLPLLPEVPVAVGDVWKEPFTVEVAESEQLKRPIKLQRVYKLTRLDDREAVIEVVTQVLSPLNNPRQESELAQRMHTGVVVLDLARGRMIRRELKIDRDVVGFDGPQTSMKVRVRHVDAFAPAGAATPLPERSSATAAPQTGEADRARVAK